MIDDKWFTITDLGGDTFAISEYGHWENVHSYLLLGREEALLIDTGLGIASMKKITDRLTSLPIKVLTTHVHWDHIGSHGEYDFIYVHEAEKEWLTDGIKGLPIEQIRRDVSRDITKPVPDTFSPEAIRRIKANQQAFLKTATSSAAIQDHWSFTIHRDIRRGISASLIRRQAICSLATCFIPERLSMLSTRRQTLWT